MRTRAERRENNKKAIQHNVKLCRDFGLRGGTVYERHREKVTEHPSYMRTGNVTHYANVGFGEKTTDRNRYGKVTRPNRSSQRKIDSYNQQLKEI